MKAVDDISLVVTGCIKPNKMQSLYLKDSEDRLVQYIDSLLFYIDYSSINKIIFCDNSGCIDQRIYDLEGYALGKGKLFEFISFVGDEKRLMNYANKGIGEAEIMDKVFSESKLIKGCYGFFKITGRLKVENINKIIANTDKHCNYFLRYAYGGVDWLDTRLYYMTCDYYNNFVTSCYDRCNNDSLALEQVFFRLVKQYKGLGHYPRFVGISGGNGYDYSKMPILEYGFFNILCHIGLFNILYPFLYYCKVVKFRMGLLVDGIYNKIVG